MIAKVDDYGARELRGGPTGLTWGHDEEEADCKPDSRSTEAKKVDIEAHGGRPPTPKAFSSGPGILTTHHGGRPLSCLGGTWKCRWLLPIPGLQVWTVLEAEHCQELGKARQEYCIRAVLVWWEDLRGGSGACVPVSWSEVSGSVWSYPTGSNQIYFSEKAFDSFLWGGLGAPLTFTPFSEITAYPLACGGVCVVLNETGSLCSPHRPGIGFYISQVTRNS